MTSYLTTNFFIVVVLGAIWRWLDGRGYPKSKYRNGIALAVSFIFTYGICYYHEVTWPWTLAIAAIITIQWTPRQKNREEFDDMLLRWGAGPVILGILIMAQANNAEGLLYAISGVLVAFLIWSGVHVKLGSIDTSAVTEAAAGATVWGSLWLILDYLK